MPWGPDSAVAHSNTKLALIRAVRRIPPAQHDLASNNLEGFQLRILGVDYSGARGDRNTWLSRGVLEGGQLVLESCGPITRQELTEILGTQNSSHESPRESTPDMSTVAALDFPFSVPREFAAFWRPEATTMPQLWSAAAAMELEEFLELRDRFVARHGEPKRLSDTFYPECYSPLHKVNPNMVPMTFRGMQMLDRLGRGCCSIPPLSPPPGAETLLLEAMPGAALKAMGLPYKGYKNGARAPQLRQAILDGLAVKSGLGLPNLRDFYSLGLANHDGLDSLVAAVVAALWAQDPASFRQPAPEGAEEFDLRVLLEGWLYAPAFI